MTKLDQFLFESFSPPAATTKVYSLPGEERCALTGRLIGSGHKVSDLVTIATSQPHEIFRYPSEYVSPEAAAVFKSMRGGAAMTGNLYAEAGYGVKPMVSRNSAEKKQRPCWHDLVMSIAPGRLSFAVFSSETKRRFWIDTPLSYTGSDWHPYLHWRNVSRVLSVNLLFLQEVLPLVAGIYGSGFSKESILTNLFSLYPQALEFGISETQALERRVQPLRDKDEFLLSVFIAQKTKEESP